MPCSFGDDMTLASDIISDASAVFLDTDEFAESISWYPKGVLGDLETITAIVTRDHEEGTREAHGDGVVNDEQEAGRTIRTSLVIEVLATVAITDPPEDMRPDLFAIDGKTWALKRVLGRDDGLQTLLVVRTDVVSKRFNPRSG